MKRAGRLLERIVERENLGLAFHRAMRGKRDRAEVREFAARLETNLRQMGDQVWSGEFALGRCIQFTIYDPKERLITAPCFAERVLHHAIMNVCERCFEQFLIDDTFACRRGKGRIAALHRAMHFSRRFPALLKLDIRKYFDSIAHEVLKHRLDRRFKDPRLLDLLGRIIDSYQTAPGSGGEKTGTGTLQTADSPATSRDLFGASPIFSPPRRGLPIGSLTSQHLANFYLGWFDRFVKETLHAPGYVRYMDDSVIWGSTSAELRGALQRCEEFLGTELLLTIKAAPVLGAARHGFEFLGCRVYPDHLKLNRRSRARFRAKLFELETAFARGELDELELQQRATALVAFTTAGGTRSWKFRTRVLQRMPVSGQGARTG